MNSLYLSNCLLCEAPLNDASIDSFCLLYCSKDTEHFSYDMTKNIIITVHDYGKFHFHLKGKDIAFIMLQQGGTAKSLYGFTEQGMFDTLENPKYSDIPSIIEKYEIRKTFK